MAIRDHMSPIEGDRGIVFEQRSGSTTPDNDTLVSTI